MCFGGNNVLNFLAQLSFDEGQRSLRAMQDRTHESPLESLNLQRQEVARVLHCEGNFQYQVLTPGQRDAAAMVIARSFCTEPLGSSLPVALTISYYLTGIDHWIDYCANNGACVIAIDTEQHRIAGVCINRDRRWKEIAHSPEYEAWFFNPSRPTYAVGEIFKELGSLAEDAAPELQEEAIGICMDLYVLAVHPDYRGKGIACNMARVCEPLVKSMGYKHHTVGASSKFTAEICRKLGFNLIAELDAKKYELDGKKVFEGVQEPHGMVTYWIKHLE
jgi:GNAT superfamily N-acetyltransferase